MRKANLREIGVGMVAPAVVVALWQLVASMGWVSPQVLPSPLAVVQKWIAYLLPLPLGLAMGASRVIDY